VSGAPDLKDNDRASTVETVDEEELYGPSQELLENVKAALTEADIAQVEALIEPLHPADVADLIEHLDPDERRLFLEITRHVIEPETISHLEDGLREQVVETMLPEELAEVVSELDSDDAVDILEDLDADRQQQVLDSIPQEERTALEEGLTYPEDSAGRLMQRDLVAVPQHWTVGEAVDYLRANQDLPDDFYDLFVVDPMHKPVGAVPLSRAMRNKRIVKLEDLMHTEFRVVPVTMDQESVAYLFRQYGLMSAPVVDDAGRLLGVITVDDVVHVIEEEAEEDLLGIVGVSETDFHAPALETAWRRVRWLVVTLCNSAIASTVISRFEATIEQIVALAILMPIVAAMGGNAGVQGAEVVLHGVERDHAAQVLIHVIAMAYLFERSDDFKANAIQQDRAAHGRTSGEQCAADFVADDDYRSSLDVVHLIQPSALSDRKVADLIEHGGHAQNLTAGLEEIADGANVAPRNHRCGGGYAGALLENVLIISIGQVVLAQGSEAAIHSRGAARPDKHHVFAQRIELFAVA